MGQHKDANTQTCPWAKISWAKISSSFDLILFLTCSETTDSIFHRCLRLLSRWVFFLSVSAHVPLGMKPWSYTHAIQTLLFPLSYSLLKPAFWGQQDGSMNKNPTAEAWQGGFYIQIPQGKESINSQKSLWPEYSHTYAHSNKTVLILGLCNLLLPHPAFCQLLYFILVCQTHRW